ncbi:Clp protease N-terminal domain-containing protein [Stenotrophomonas sp. SY1]|uniref:Clp protease N-terminal domain-containing protein n=1 Tax=Stenotrophomonas sp. SY1 TaxID=477235 RepID=UPI001E5B7D0B|nr:Clp protease N-terminal domain-containing protein [Stenotrophomonas sp. SY1]MCD9085699.1 hypothetical protein [Stenotrophomonas sp. SY1]
MLTLFSRYAQDSRTLAELCSAAEEIARGHGRAKPSSEHFVLAALGLDDRTAIEAFKHLSLTEADFLGALDSQHEAALSSVGMARPAALPGPPTDALVAPKGRLYQADASGQTLVQRLAQSRSKRKGRSLLGADVLLSVAQEAFTPASRAFRSLGISTVQITEAASAAIASRTARASNA